MSRGVIYTATFKDFLNGLFLVDVPTGYTRVQFNQFTAGARPYDLVVGGGGGANPDWGWLKMGEQNVAEYSSPGSTLIVRQNAPYDMTYSSNPGGSLIMKVWCDGIDAQNNIIAAGKIGDTITLGMNGTPYKITNRNLKIYLTNEIDQLVNNLGVILQFTFL